MFLNETNTFEIQECDRFFGIKAIIQGQRGYLLFMLPMEYNMQEAEVQPGVISSHDPVQLIGITQPLLRYNNEILALVLQVSSLKFFEAKHVVALQTHA